MQSTDRLAVNGLLLFLFYKFFCMQLYLDFWPLKTFKKTFIVGVFVRGVFLKDYDQLFYG